MWTLGSAWVPTHSVRAGPVPRRLLSCFAGDLPREYCVDLADFSEIERVQVAVLFLFFPYRMQGAIVIFNLSVLARENAHASNANACMERRNVFRWSKMSEELCAFTIAQSLDVWDLPTPFSRASCSFCCVLTKC